MCVAIAYQYQSNQPNHAYSLEALEALGQTLIYHPTAINPFLSINFPASTGVNILPIQTMHVFQGKSGFHHSKLAYICLCLIPLTYIQRWVIYDKLQGVANERQLTNPNCQQKNQASTCYNEQGW